MRTELTPSGSGINATLDDASSQITYSGFTSTQAGQSSISAINSGSFYQNTVSYTSSVGSSATFSFVGSALYIFGPTGPSFGVFQVEIDDSVIGTFNASTTVNLYNTLLFFVTHLGSTSQHGVVVTNQDDGKFLALDYCVSVQPETSAETATGN
ncbi:MAG: hypothetical protein TREMPRED_001507, partial [Tremellales sp. Tagirdzhanova-0007]